jgi:ribonuclease P protein component
VATAGRLRTAAEFQQVYKTGRPHYGPSFTVRVAAADRAAAAVAAEPSAFGFVVSAKVSKSAVVRNRIRRRAREFVRRNAAELVPGRAVAVIAKPGAAALSPAETVRELSSLFKQATLIR